MFLPKLGNSMMIDDAATTRDRWYDGSLTLIQPAQGFRATSDALLLAASVPQDVQDVLEPGCGVGAVMVALAKRLPRAMITGFDSNPDMLALAQRNATNNQFSDRITLTEADVTVADIPPHYDHVVINPPYNRKDSTLSDNQQRRASMAADDLDSWVKTASGALVTRGGVTIISRVDRLDEILIALARHNLGEVVIKPIQPMPDKPARRLLIRARKGVRGDLCLLSPFIMRHDAAHATAEAESLSNGAAIILIAPGRRHRSPANIRDVASQQTKG